MHKHNLIKSHLINDNVPMEVRMLRGAAMNRSVYELIFAVEAPVAIGGRRVPKNMVDPFLAVLLTNTLLSAPINDNDIGREKYR